MYLYILINFHIDLQNDDSLNRFLLIFFEINKNEF